MTHGANDRLGSYVEMSTGGERVRAYVPATLPPNPPLELGRFMHIYERAMAAVGRLDGVTTILPSTRSIGKSPLRPCSFAGLRDHPGRG